MADQDQHSGVDPPGAVDGAPLPGSRPRDGADPVPVTVSGPDDDWMTRARREAEVDAWEPGQGLQDDPVIELPSAAALVRPYARTGGRTKPVRHLDLEALVRTTVSGKEASTGPWLNPEHMTIIDLCTGTVSVAEVAVRLAVPIGVARVIIADMVDLGLVEVMKTSAADGDERDPAFLRRVLSGLQRL